MADTRELQVVITARDEATKVLQSLGHSFGNLVNDSKAASSAFAFALGAVGKNIIDVSSDLEQAKVSFSVMTGSAKTATKTLGDLSEFAKKTPFTFPEIVEASKRLLAYNVSAKDLIPTLSTLGNIAAGVGTEKMPQLILAFGQVKAATRLTGMELRQFSEAGVPLLQTLVDQMNETGGVMTKVGGASAATTKKIASLGSATEEARFKMEYMRAEGKEGTKQYQALGEKIKYNEARIASFGSVGQDVYAKVKVSAAQLKDAISDGAVSFKQVEKALNSIGGKGGKWGDLMAQQAKTFKGTLSNIQDQLIRVAYNIAGISTETETFGDIISGGPFDLLKKQAVRVLEQLDILEPKIKTIMQEFAENGQLMAIAIGILVGGLLGATVVLWQFLAPLIALMAIGAAVGAALNWLYQGFITLDPVVMGVASGIAVVSGLIIGSLIPSLVAAAAAWVAANLAMLLSVAGFTAIGLAIAVLVAGIIWAVDQYRILTDAQYANEVQTQNLKRAKEELKRATEDLANAEDNTTAASNRLEAANLAVERAQRAYTIAVSNHGPKSLEAREAANRLKLAQDGVKTSTKDVEKATFEEIEAQKKAIEQHKKVVEAAKPVKSAFDGIAGAIKGAIDAFIKWSGLKNGGGKGGGNSYQHGGFVQGSYNQAVPAILHGGERVIPRNGVDVNSGSGGGGGITINFSGPVSMDSEERVQELANTIIRTLGRQNELAGKGLTV